MPRKAWTPSRAVPRTAPPVVRTVDSAVMRLAWLTILFRSNARTSMSVPPPPSRALVPVLIFLSTCVAVISSLGAPLVPAIAAATGTTPAQAQWSLTVTLLVGAVAPTVVGGLGDGPDRRPVVLTVLALVVLGGV